jgi:catechol 2,3-dioxygenase-like lactoylglutathione lyase family enzyme
MEIGTLDHVNLRTTRLTEMAAWYGEVLGLTKGWRPDFAFPGIWLYAGKNAYVHLIGISGEEAAGSEVAGGLKLEHFAFTASGAAEFEARLAARGEPFRKSEVPGAGTVAFNIWDPDGNHVHVDFPLHE